MNRARACLPVLFLSLSATICRADDPALIAGVFSPPRPAPDFSLAGSDGAELRLATYLGKVVILGFGYTSCPEICPTTLAVLADARRQLGVRAGELQVVYVTVDPETDTPEQMRRFLASFDPTFVGGTGTEQELAAVRREYGILASRQLEGDGYSYSHSSYTYLIDRDGKLRALMPYGHRAADYVHDVGVLLEE